MKSLGVCYWYVNMPRCGWVEHGLKYITVYVQKHKYTIGDLFLSPVGSRRAARGARICQTCLLGLVSLIDRLTLWEESIGDWCIPITKDQ